MEQIARGRASPTAMGRTTANESQCGSGRVGEGNEGRLGEHCVCHARPVRRAVPLTAQRELCAFARERRRRPCQDTGGLGWWVVWGCSPTGVGY
eukprot:4132540-Prymnesium_polylepis.3